MGLLLIAAAGAQAQTVPWCRSWSGTLCCRTRTRHRNFPSDTLACLSEPDRQLRLRIAGIQPQLRPRGNLDRAMGRSWPLRMASAVFRQPRPEAQHL